MTDEELEQPLPRAIEEWREISGEIPEELRIEVARLIDRHKAALANRFYTTMLSDAEAAPLLGHELINERLRFSLQNWLSGIFQADDDADLSEAVAMQKKIGLVHARIHVPIHVVMRGARVLKREIASRFIGAGFSPDALYKAKNNGRNRCESSFTEA